MNKKFFLLSALLFIMAFVPVQAQQQLTWEQLKARFEAANPQLKADALAVDEMKAAELTAAVRPNPQLTLATDGTQIARHNGVWQPLSGTDMQSTLSYLHERDHKRELRQQSAHQGTEITAQQHADLERNLLFNLRTVYIATLEAKEICRLAKDDLDYYDHIIQISRDRFKAGDLAQVDLDRIELLRVQYESEWQQAVVGLRTAKIQLLQLLNDRTPVEQFDVIGEFTFSETLKSLEDYRQTALDARPDLRAALLALEQANTNHKLAIANGSTDPTLSGWYTWNASNNNPNAQQTLGMSVNVPLRIFDRNQGEKQRTLIDIDRNRQTTEAARAQVFSDVDSAYAQVESSIALLKPYKAHYNDQALRVRDTVTYSYQHGAASLMDFLNAQSDYRQVQLAYVQLTAAYLTAAGQLNLAAGSEVLP
jgi:cobalt-zinc-cadmium efflux system outer membrane protein